MSNSGTRACTITVMVNNRVSGPWRYPLDPGASTEDWFGTGSTQGWYNLTAATDGFSRSFAGHMENGTRQTSDPAMGAGPPR
jgi:phospholipase C